MRYLVCGDIHGNLPALELMLAKEKDNYDQFICHGDIVNYGPWSDDCVKLLNTIKDSILLKGNHEIYFLSGIYNGSNVIAKTFFNYCYDKFTEFELIKKYSNSVLIGNYKIQHTILDKYIFLDTKIDQLDQDYIIGHSHQQYNRTIGNKKLVNITNILAHSINQIQEIAILLSPFLPNTSQKILEQFQKQNIKSDIPLFPRI